MPIFDENNFIKLVIDAYINEGYDTILCLFLEDFLETSTRNTLIKKSSHFESR